MKNIFVTRNNSKTGKPYFALCVDLGYRRAVLTFDTSLIAEIIGVSVADLYAFDYIRNDVIYDVVKK